MLTTPALIARPDFGSLTLSPTIAIVLLLVMLFAGRSFRLNWKAQEPGWEQRAWAFGVPAAIAFFALAFIPVQGA
ncbi:hypothetical protein [Amaricoccus macauensis]|uniref:hypothetical protein n=1 Tax=Amaricoccus macauensis TaxID=57001 RepID=UPI003C7ECE06